MAIPGYYSLLQRGSSGPDVALVQTWLNGVRDACTWYDALKADGKFGVGTQRAVQEFQLKNKMNMDGKVGAEHMERALHPLHRQTRAEGALPRHRAAHRLLRRHGAAGTAEAQLSGRAAER